MRRATRASIQLPNEPLQALAALGHEIHPVDGEPAHILQRDDDVLAIVANSGRRELARLIQRSGARFGVSCRGSRWRVVPAGALFRGLTIDVGVVGGPALAAALLGADGLLWTWSRDSLRGAVCADGALAQQVRDAHTTGEGNLALLDPEVVGEAHEGRLGRARRRQGSYYTPATLARTLAELALRPLLARASGTDDVEALRLLDPAAGSGQILVALLGALTQAWLERATGPVQLNQVRRTLLRCLVGADLDSAALAVTRLRLQLLAHVPGRPPAIPCLLEGDALLEVLPEDAQPAGDLLPALDAAVNALHGDGVRAVHWRAALPDVFSRGGFDAVVGNPPYHRELDGKELFARVRRSRLGVHARSKGDLWFFFTHLALDLLRPGGQHAFVVPAYWLKATGQGPRALRERLRRDGRWRALLDLQRIPVFDAVAGRHVVFCVERRDGQDGAPAKLYRARAGATLKAVERAVRSGSAAGVECVAVCADAIYGRRGEVLIDLALDPQECALLGRLQGGALPAGWELSEGITANPERLTARAMQRVRETTGVDLGSRGLEPGAPVFVVPSDWPRARRLSVREREHLVAYLHPRAISRLRSAPGESTPWLIYTTPGNVQDAREIPQLAVHLGLTREVMEQRRETRRGSRAWFHLHWPRRPSLFEGPRVLVPRMTRWPSASLTSARCATGESVYTIVPARREWSPLVATLLNSLPFALGILLTTKARGKGIDIPRAALASCPWPDAAVLESAQRGAHPLARALAASERLATEHAMATAHYEGPWWRHADDGVAAIGRELDEAVCDWLEVSYESLRAMAEEALDA